MGCKSNYNNQKKDYITIFQFPGDAHKQDFCLRKIPCKDWVPGPTARVCILHFIEKFISRHEEYIDKDRKKTFPQKRAVSLLSAVPTIFPNLPSYLTCSSSSDREKRPAEHKL